MNVNNNSNNIKGIYSKLDKLNNTMFVLENEKNGLKTFADKINNRVYNLENKSDMITQNLESILSNQNKNVQYKNKQNAYSKTVKKQYTGSCKDKDKKCGSYKGGASCQCDDNCVKYGDCCKDKEEVCNINKISVDKNT